MLRPELLRRLGLDTKQHRFLPAEFQELSTQGYLAVVHVDGNSVGKRFKGHSHAFLDRDFFERGPTRKRSSTPCAAACGAPCWMPSGASSAENATVRRRYPCGC